MSKIDALASGSSANARPQGDNNTVENAGGMRKVPRRDPPSPRLGRDAGVARPAQQAPSNQEAMDSEESTVNRETATAAAQIPKGGELTVILTAITQINEKLSAIDARFEALEGQEAELLLHIDGLEHKPDVIALQETNSKPRLPGYVTYTDPTEEGTAVLVRSNVAATQHVTAQGGCEHTLVEIHARTIGNTGNLYVMSAYCRPSQRQYDFDRVVSQAKRLAGSRPLLILGDFNAPHTTWGYKYQSKRGKALANTMEDHEMALLNEPDVATRRGNSANRDTTPDLSWLSGALDVSWRNEDVDLGSDHSVIGITIKGPQYRAMLGTARVTDWGKMRKYTHEIEEASENDKKADRKQTYAEWARDQKMALEKFTQEITTTAQTPFVDARLAHMWAARHSLTRRWKRQRHNKKLVKRIAVLNKQIAEYAAKLCQENWLSTCDGLQGKLSARKTWCLLRHLIDPMSSKTATNRNLTKILNTYKGDGRRLLEDLKAKYLKTERGQYSMPERYGGPENEEMDRPFTMTELWSAIDDSNRKSAPGRDAITYKLLGNMSEAAARGLLDVLIQLQELVVKKATGNAARGILALDLKGAFDNVSHASVLQNLNKTGCGRKTFGYIKDFLTRRTATIRIGEETSEPVELGERGTPQGRESVF
ncbi:uncharacterized protein LOC144161527 [Haemaphysalis longicornis]